MPTLLTRTFALLNNIKPPTNNTDNVETSNNNVLLLPPSKNTPEQIKLTSTVLAPPSPQRYTSTPDISIWKAAEQGDLAALQYYVHHTNSVDPTTLLNTRDPDTDCTLLHLVVSNNNNSNTLLLLQLLLEHGADATARNVYNVQVIHMVSLHCPNPLASIELLLNHKASPNARDGDGWTPLHYAARFCQPPERVLQLLVARGADVNLTDAGHKSPLFGLLANGDLTTALDWLVHTAKADVSIRGDFLDQVSRKTRPGTIVLQAAKYGRLDCLSLLIKSTVAMNQLRRVIHRDELNHANYLVKEQQTRLRKVAGSEQQVQKLDLILSLLQELEDTLERDPLSLLNSRKLNSSATLPVNAETPAANNKIQRRHSSFMSMLGSIRSRKRLNNGVKRKDSTTSKLFRKMSRIIRRTKSENNAAVITNNTHQQQSSSENRSNGPSR